MTVDVRPSIRLKVGEVRRVRYAPHPHGDPDSNRGLWLMLEDRGDGRWFFLVITPDGADDGEREGQVRCLSDHWFEEFTRRWDEG